MEKWESLYYHISVEMWDGGERNEGSSGALVSVSCAN
jgi:hypothetical protein